MLAKAHFVNRAGAVLMRGLFEGVKMEVAMQSPISRAIGDADELPGVGESFTTGVGFGIMQGVVPWSKMFDAVIGQKSGFWRGMADLTVKAPLSFAVASEAATLLNAYVDDLQGDKTFSNFLEEHYGDFSEFSRHVITELMTGLALGLGHFAGDFKTQKYNFVSSLIKI